MVRNKSPQLKIASDLLFMPDIFNYFLTGIKKTEFTEATTSALYNPNTGAWDDGIFRQLGVSKSLMQEIVPSETIIGSLTGDISAQTGLEGVSVVVGASHDTAAAVAAVPASGENFAFISSGTWSLMGIESKTPTINEKTLEYNIANQGGAGQTFMVLKNITGLWLLKECRNVWAKAREYSYDELIQMAAEIVPLGTVIDPDHPDFLKPDSMPIAIEEFCRTTGQPVPQDIGQFVRIILDSLALTYCHSLKQLEEVKGEKIAQINIVGGGSQNSLLCQFTADATGLPVYAGPVEATAIGNILVQTMALGKISSLDEIREIVKRSFRPNLYEPQPTSYWDKTYEQFVKLKRM
jgi:rhamnulokinase